MTVNGKELQADLLPADQARKTYEEIVRKLKDPGLLEYAGTRMLKARIFPIEPRSDVKIALRYTQVAQADGGVYHLRYPLRSAQPNAGQVDQLAVRVAVKASKPVKLFYCPTHKLDVVRKGESEVTGGFELRGGLPDRDVDVYWSVDAGDVGVGVSAFKPPDEDGYCLIALSPRLQAADREVQPKDVVFAFDRSGSMDGEKIRQARSALRYCLGHLRREDRFGLIAYGSAVDVLTPGLVEATTDAVERARGQVETLDARGGTALHDALLKSFDLLGREPRLPMVVFLTDGRPTIGPADLDEVLSAARKANAARARLFAFGVGYDLNTDLLDRLATENGGTQQYVAEGEDIEVKVSGFYDKISQPVLAGVTVEAKGVELRDLYPRQPPDLFASGQVLLFGRYRGSGRHDVVVRGKVRDREQVFETTANFDGSAANAFVPAVWAQRKVAFLLEQIRLHGREKELEEEVVSLGKRYGILTPYTSFLVVDDRAPQPLREVAAASRRSFEFEKDGRTAFYQSRGVAAAKAADAMAAPGAPLVLGMGGEGNGDIYGVGVGHGVAGAASPLVRQAVERVRRAGGKTFYLQDDGCYYDSTFAEAQRPRIEEIEPLSDAWFALLDRHPGIGVYLAARFPMVLCMEGRVYRIRNV
jgi:Ca-activated chloride channel family protein